MGQQAPRCLKPREDPNDKNKYDVLQLRCPSIALLVDGHRLTARGKGPFFRLLYYLLVLGASMIWVTFVMCHDRTLDDTKLSDISTKTMTNGTESNITQETANSALVALAKVKLPSCDDTPNLTALGTKFDSFVGFILAGYISLVIARWWAMRTNGIGALTDACGDITRLLGTLCLSTETCTETRHNVEKQIRKIYTIAVWSLPLMSTFEGQTKRGSKEEEEEVWDKGFTRDLAHIKADEEVNFVTELGVLEKDKIARDRTSSTNSANQGAKSASRDEKAQIMWARISSLAAQLMCQKTNEVNEVPSPSRSMVYQQISKAFEGMSTQATYLQTQLPFRYVWLIHFMVEIDMTLYVFLAGPKVIQSWLVVNSGEGDYWTMVPIVFPIAIFPLIYGALLSLCVHMSDPVGSGKLDFHLEKDFREPTHELCDRLLDVFLYQPEPPSRRRTL